jgi:hypothetical protein
VTRGEVQPLSGGEVLISGDAVLWFATMAERAVLAQRGNGMRSPLFDGWLDTLRDAAARTRACSGIGTSEVPIPAGPPSSGLTDPISTVEAAAMLRTTPRNVTALCQREVLSSARKVAGRWQIERAEVTARAERTAA